MVGISLNDFWLENVLLKTPYKDTLDKELDQLNLVIKSTTPIEFKKNDKIGYLRTQYYGTFPNGQNAVIIDKKFCLFSFLEKKDGAYYTYELNMLSPTKLLENIIINGMASTETGGNLHTQLSDVVAKINAQQLIETSNSFYGATPIITYEAESSNPLASFARSEFLWSGQQTAREILSDIAYKANRLVIGTDFEAVDDEITSITITTKAMEPNGNQIASGTSLRNVLSSIGCIKGYTKNFDSEYANGKLISLVKNAICKDVIKGTYLPPRNDDLSIDDSADWHILTDYPIYNLNNVIALLPVSTNWVRYWNGDELATKQHTQLHTFYIPTNITSYIVEKDVFDAMSLSEQAKHLYFKRGEKGIYGLFKKYKSGLSGLFSEIALRNINVDNPSRIPFFTAGSYAFWSWQNCSDAPFLIDGEAHYNATTDFPYQVSRDGTRHNGDIYDFRYGSSGQDWGSPYEPSTNDYKNSLFSVSYQPYADSVVLTEKTNLSNSRALNMGVMKNQSDRTIDAEKYYDSQNSFAERMGNNEVVVNISLTDVKGAYENNDYTQKLWDLGDYFMINSVKWTCIAREIDNETKDNIKASLTFSEGYNARNLAINENRDKRLYGIPLNNYVDRFIVIKTTSYRAGYKCLVRCWDDFTGSTTTQGYCLKDIVAIGSGNNKDGVVAMNDNYSVAIEKTTYSSTKVNVFLRYCDRFDGKLETLNIVVCSQENLYDRLLHNDSLGYQRLPFMNTRGSIDGGAEWNLNVKKDKMERLILVFKNMN